jgi:hypothetical protein
MNGDRWARQSSAVHCGAAAMLSVCMLGLRAPLIIGLWLLLASSARADAADNPFGARGQVVPLGGVSFEVELGAGTPGPEGGLGHNLGFGLSPGVLYFFAPGLALGLSLDLSYLDRELEITPYTELDLGPSVGFGLHAPLSASLGLFPRLWLGTGYMRREYELIDFVPSFADPTFQTEPSFVTKGAYLSVQLLLPLTVQLVYATFISIGPSVRLHWALKEGSRTLDFGMSAGVGRYF